MTDKSVLTFPCEFPIKIFGHQDPDLLSVLYDIVVEYVPDFDKNMMSSNPSKSGKYLAVTITITATSQTQLDDLYRALHAHEMVVMLL